MSKYFQILLAEFYVIVTGYGLIALLRCWGLPIASSLSAELLLGWTTCCFSSASINTSLLLSSLHVRKPVKAEEDTLNTLFREVLQQAGIDKSFRLLIQEEMSCNAFAIGLRTIVVTRGLLEKMDPAELKGILAHELGHLQSRDCLVGAAFASAGLLPLLVAVVYEKGKRVLLYGLRCSIAVLSILNGCLLLGFLLSVAYWCYSRHVLMPVVATAVFVWLFRKVRNLFGFLWRTITRFREYQQDAYACRLGYGTALHQALLKSTLNKPQSVSLCEILMGSDHPMIYNRIRRLEKWEELR